MRIKRLKQNTRKTYKGSGKFLKTLMRTNQKTRRAPQIGSTKQIVLNPQDYVTPNLDSATSANTKFGYSDVEPNGTENDPEGDKVLSPDNLRHMQLLGQPVNKQRVGVDGYYGDVQQSLGTSTSGGSLRKKHLSLKHKYTKTQNQHTYNNTIKKKK